MNPGDVVVADLNGVVVVPRDISDELLDATRLEGRQGVGLRLRGRARRLQQRLGRRDARGERRGGRGSPRSTSRPGGFTADEGGGQGALMAKVAPRHVGRARPRRNPLLSATSPPAVILGGGGTALPVARSLGDGRHPGVRAREPARPGAPLAALHARSLPRAASPACRSGGWSGCAARPSGSVVLPCEDEGIDLIARNRDMLLDLGLVPFEADDEVLLAMLDKHETYRLCARARHRGAAQLQGPLRGGHRGRARAASPIRAR